MEGELQVFEAPTQVCVWGGGQTQSNTAKALRAELIFKLQLNFN